MVRTGTRSGGVHQPSPVSLLVSLAISNVKKRFKAEHAKAKREERYARENEKRANRRRMDAEMVEKLLNAEQCAVRFKMHGAFPMVRRDVVDRDKWLKRHESMKCTSVSERDYKTETPLDRALRQKMHCQKDVLGMNDIIFYKHMRDHNLEPEEAHAEVLRRKRLIHTGCGSTYEPPEMGHLVLGLLDGKPIPDSMLPPKVVVNPWHTFLVKRLVVALEAF